MSAPNATGIVVLPKKGTLWQQALAQFLAGTAEDAAKTGIANETQRDYAGQFGETPSTGFDKLLHGARVNQAGMEQRTGEENQNNRQENSIASAMALEKASEEAATGRTGMTEAGAGSRLATSEAGQNTRSAAANAIQERIAQAAEAGQTSRLGQSLQAEAPVRAAQAGAEEARAAQEEQAVKEGQMRLDSSMYHQIYQPYVAPKAAPVNPNIAAFAGGKTTASANPLDTPATPSDVDMINTYLSKGMNPDDIATAMTAQKTAQATAATQAALAQKQQDVAATAKSAAIQQILNKINPEDAAASQFAFPTQSNPFMGGAQ